MTDRHLPTRSMRSPALADRVRDAARAVTRGAPRVVLAFLGLVLAGLAADGVPGGGTSLVAPSALAAQDRGAYRGATGAPDVHLSLRGSTAYRTATITLSRPAYTALFLVERGVGATLLYPYRPGDADHLDRGTHRLDLSVGRLAAHERFLGSSLSRRSRLRASHRSHTSDTYLLVVAARTPLRIAGVRSMRTIRPSPRSGGSSLALADEVLRRVVADYRGHDWSYDLRPFTLDHVRSTAYLHGPGVRSSRLCSSPFLFSHRWWYSPWYAPSPWLHTSSARRHSTFPWWRCPGNVFFLPGETSHPGRQHPSGQGPGETGDAPERLDPESIRVGHPIPRDLPRVRPEGASEETGSTEDRTRIRAPRVQPLRVPQRVRPQRLEPRRIRPQRVEPQRLRPQRIRPERVRPREVQPQEARPQRVRPQRVRPQRVRPQKVQPKKPVRPKKKPVKPKKDDGDGS